MLLMFSRGFKDIIRKTTQLKEFPGLENKFPNSRGFKEIKDTWEPCQIDELVCPPNICETVAVRIMKLAHRPRIASTTIKLISKSILLAFLSSLLKQFSQSELGRRQIRGMELSRRSHFFVFGDSADSVLFRFVDNLVLPSGRSICIILFSLHIRIVLTYSYGEFNCDGLHILITFIYIIAPLLTSIHKPVLARDPSSNKQ